MPADVTARRRRPTSAAVVLAIGARLVYPADGPTGADDSFPDDRSRAVTGHASHTRRPADR